MQNAIMAGVLASVACGIIGGIGLAFFLGISPLLGASAFAIISALIMAQITLKNKNRADTVIGAMWALGMAIGIILLDITPGYNVDLMSYLFGSIMAVPDGDLAYMAGLDLMIILFVLLAYRQIHAVSFDSDFAISMGVRADFIYTMMLLMSALAVVLLIRVAGLILIISMLTIPPYIAEKHMKTLKGMMILSAILSLIFTLTGLAVAYSFNLTSGASIILVSAISFFLSSLYKR